ncbi:Proteophosphoglycan ppg4 [Rhodotorula toruloides ATCC 204091]|uniref:Proteophosphoglycan ppg4 n=1 Tax=Rhodotorula toruloides TaxID=5286 RepID=A0A0K3CQ94_RHOTO|nr:Proteophosphoglycan ppg4 [Rhodotorula toruloides ATCC 204091]KAK4329914.1 Proteophosphoglycan ppg4 [Rhodotorula toruloides]PRQ72018.1 Proteophosphoglycan ppg4 [Rhodotorula toruloides]
MLRRQATGQPAHTPYGAVLAELVRELHPRPAPGFRGRVYVLDALTAGYIALALAYLALLLSRRWSKGGTSLRLTRRVQLATGTLLVVDSHLVLTCTTVATGALSLASLGSLSTFGHTGMAASFGLRAMSIVPLFVQGWGLLWSALQGLWVAMPQSSVGGLPSAKAANGVFLAVGGCVCLAGLGAGLFAAVAGHNLYSAFFLLRTTLTALESSSTTPSIAAMLRLAPGLSVLRRRTKDLRAAMLATYSVVFLMTLVILATCAYGLYVHSTTSRPSTPAIQLPLTPPAVDPKTGMSKTAFIDDVDGLGARMGEEEDVWRFRKAKDDLLLVCVSVGTLSATMAGLGAFSVFLSFSGRIFQSNGALFEIAHLSFSYLYALVQLLLFTFLLHDSSLAPSSDSAAEEVELALKPRRVAASCRVIRQVRWLARRIKSRRREGTHVPVRQDSGSSGSESLSTASQEMAEQDLKGEKSVVGSFEGRRSFEEAIERMPRVTYGAGTVVV